MQRPSGKGYTKIMNQVTNMTWKSCSNCRKMVYLTERDAKHAVGCYFFCKCCDIAYYDWKMRTGNVLAQVFLASVEARRARLPRYARNYF